jgi:rubrerythrin
VLGRTPTGEDASVTTEASGGAAPEPIEGGDPACWLSRVCPECGRLADDDPPTRCPSCGAALADD